MKNVLEMFLTQAELTEYNEYRSGVVEPFVLSENDGDVDFNGLDEFESDAMLLGGEEF